MNFRDIYEEYKKNEIADYDKKDTSKMIDSRKALSLNDFNLELPEEQPTKVISLRLPSGLLNQVKAYASQNDISYTAMIKILLAAGVKGLKC